MFYSRITPDQRIMSEPTKATPYAGDPCPRKCTCCPDQDGDYPTEHHWMLEYVDEENVAFDPAGYLACRHCEAVREIPIDDDEFLEAFGL